MSTSTERVVRAARLLLAAVVLLVAACGQDPTVQTPTPLPPGETETATGETQDPAALVLVVDVADGLVHPESRLAVTGRSTPAATVRLDGQPGGVLVGDDGAWTLVVDLVPGDNLLRFEASLVGHDPVTRTLTVVHEPSSPDPPFSP